MKLITKEFLESEITDVTYTRLSGTLTHCAIKTKNGFIFTGESACVDEASFDKDLGEKYAYEQAFEKMWPPYGFWLKQKLHDEKTNAPTPQVNEFNFGNAITLLKQGKKVARKGWNGKGIFIGLHKPSDDELMSQEFLYIDTTGLQTDNNYAPKSCVPWLASQTDILAEDWTVAQ